MGRLSDKLNSILGTFGKSIPGNVSRSGQQRLRPVELEERVVGLASRYGVTLLRYSLGANFIWFGALKVTNSSPVGELVADTVRQPDVQNSHCVLL